MGAGSWDAWRAGGTVKITIDVDKCIGSGSCEMIAPGIFEVGNDGLVQLLEDSPSAEHHGAVRTAAASCPTQVIAVDD
ncbi:MAG: ferredoxin [Acidimicrobiaceae bacterium]|nr:ferredoxin [Acidimicrobiaceae bacterium]